MGCHTMDNLVAGGFAGDLYPVNPGHTTLHGLPCFDDLRSLPQRPDLVIFCVGDRHLEAALDEALTLDVPAVSIMSSLVLDGDDDPPLKARISEKLEQNGTLACGANGMGFYNMADRVWAYGFDGREHGRDGNVTMISHSGSGLCGILDCEERIRFNLAVSAGNELSVTMDEYLDFALDLPDTRVVGLFVETARNPAGFCAALEKANARRIPVVAIKVGRTERSAELAVSHSGAIAGDDAAYAALFDRYGVVRVNDMDELATTLIMFATMFPVGPGGLVALHDSGGERQLLIDLADAAGVPLPALQESSVRALQGSLDPELPAVNPLDGWSRGGEHADERMTRCLSILMQDPGAALAALVHDRAPGGSIYAEYVEYMRPAAAESGKAVALVSSRQGTGSDPLVVQSTHAGLPVLDGVATFLVGARALLAYRDFLERDAVTNPAPSQRVVDRWLPRIRGRLGEAVSLELLTEFGIPTVARISADNAADAMAAADRLQYPVAVKTAADGILHKTEQRGVHIDVRDAQALEGIYSDMSTRLGPEVMIQSMAQPGVEMMLGARRDPQFGPIVLFGFGGVHAELLSDVVFALPPFDSSFARRQLDRLRLRPLLDGQRGSQACDVGSFCDMASDFSRMVDALRERIREIDVNPVIVGRDGGIAVDALLIAD